MSLFLVKPGMRRPRHLALCGLLFALGGCSSTGVGNPAPALSLSLSLVNDDSAEYADAAGAGGASGEMHAAATPDAAAGAEYAAAGSGGEAPGLDYGAAGSSDNAEGGSSAVPAPLEPLPVGTIQDAVIVLGELQFLPCDKARGNVFTASGPFIVDLKHRTTSPEIPDIDATPGGYCGIDAPLAAATAPAALAGRSVFFDGHRADGTFFIVYANMVATLRMRAKDGAKWQGMEPPPRFFWALHPRRWLLTAELNAADTSPYGNRLRAVVIDANRHAALFLALRSRIAGISKMYADANGNGVFDDPDRNAEVGVGLEDAD